MILDKSLYQLVASPMPNTLMGICNQLLSTHQGRDVHPAWAIPTATRQLDLQLMALCTVNLSQS